MAIARMERSVIRGRPNQRQCRSRITRSLSSGRPKPDPVAPSELKQETSNFLLPRLQESGERLQRYLRDVMLDALGVRFGGFGRTPIARRTSTTRRWRRATRCARAVPAVWRKHAAIRTSGGHAAALQSRYRLDGGAWIRRAAACRSARFAALAKRSAMIPHNLRAARSTERPRLAQPRLRKLGGRSPFTPGSVALCALVDAPIAAIASSNSPAFQVSVSIFARSRQSDKSV